MNAIARGRAGNRFGPPRSWGGLPSSRAPPIPEILRYLLTSLTMDYLWTPWRYAYVTSAGKISGCIFCELPGLNDDVKAGIVYRGEHCFIILNSYPYTPGH